MLDDMLHDIITTRIRERYELDMTLNNIKQYWTILDSTGQYETIQDDIGIFWQYGVVGSIF